MGVVLQHATRILILAAAGVLLLAPFHLLIGDVGAEMHARAAPPDEEGLIVLDRLLDELDRFSGGVVIHDLHALFGQRSGILELAVRR